MILDHNDPFRHWLPSAWHDEGLDWSLTRIKRTDGLDLVAPVAPDLVKSHLRLSTIDDDQLRYINSLVATGWRDAERVSQRALSRQTWELKVTGFPCGAIRIPRPPLVSVVDVQYRRPADGVLTSWTTSPPPYQVGGIGAHRARGLLAPNPTERWPLIDRRYLDSVVITFSCGYAFGSAPPEICHGILLTVGELYKTRTESIQGIISTPAYRTAKSLWEGWRS